MDILIQNEITRQVDDLFFSIRQKTIENARDIDVAWMIITGTIGFSVVSGVIFVEVGKVAPKNVITTIFKNLLWFARIRLLLAQLMSFESQHCDRSDLLLVHRLQLRLWQGQDWLHWRRWQEQHRRCKGFTGSCGFVATDHFQGSQWRRDGMSRSAPRRFGSAPAMSGGRTDGRTGFSSGFTRQQQRTPPSPAALLSPRRRVWSDCSEQVGSDLWVGRANEDSGLRDVCCDLYSLHPPHRDALGVGERCGLSPCLLHALTRNEQDGCLPGELILTATGWCAPSSTTTRDPTGSSTMEEEQSCTSSLAPRRSSVSRCSDWSSRADQPCARHAAPGPSQGSICGERFCVPREPVVSEEGEGGGGWSLTSCAPFPASPASASEGAPSPSTSAPAPDPSVPSSAPAPAPAPSTSAPAPSPSPSPSPSTSTPAPDPSVPSSAPAPAPVPRPCPCPCLVFLVLILLLLPASVPDSCTWLSTRLSLRQEVGSWGWGGRGRGRDREHLAQYGLRCDDRNHRRACLQQELLPASRPQQRLDQPCLFPSFSCLLLTTSLLRSPSLRELQW
eukprot:764240-Hanusia_phi.AAC.2